MGDMSFLGCLGEDATELDNDAAVLSFFLINSAACFGFPLLLDLIPFLPLFLEYAPSLDNDDAGLYFCLPDDKVLRTGLEVEGRFLGFLFEP